MRILGNIAKDIEAIVALCPTWQQHRKSQMKETLHPHEIPTHWWQFLGIDLFQFDGDNYLIVADYHSKFGFVTYNCPFTVQPKHLWKLPKSCSQSKEFLRR